METYNVATLSLRIQHFMQHTKFAMLNEILDPFKRTDFIEHFMKGEKILRWMVLDEICFRTNFSSNILYPTLKIHVGFVLCFRSFERLFECFC